MITPQLTDARVLSGYRLWVRFSDGIEGELDLSGELWGEVFSPLRDESLFRQFELDEELNTVRWKNGADLAPEFLYEECQRNARATAG